MQAPHMTATFGGLHFSLQESSVMSVASKGPSGLAGLSEKNIKYKHFTANS